MQSHKLSIKEHILQLALEPKYRYMGFPMSALGIPALFPYKKQSIRNSLSQLQKNGFIKKVGEDRIMVQAKGKAFYEKKANRLILFDSPFSKKQKKNIIIIFDIPEDKKHIRNWLRTQLIAFGYDMVQKSTWIGPGPLPQAFIEYSKSLGIGKDIKFFVLAQNQKIYSL